jgi:methionyl-tRNA synthetase
MWPRSTRWMISAARRDAPPTRTASRSRVWLQPLDTTVQVAADLRAAEPGAAGTETFDAQERTTIALKLAAVRQLAVLLAPLAPSVAAGISQAIGLDTDPGSTPWSRALEFVPAGQTLPSASDLDALD